MSTKASFFASCACRPLSNGLEDVGSMSLILWYSTIDWALQSPTFPNPLDSRAGGRLVPFDSSAVMPPPVTPFPDDHCLLLMARFGCWYGFRHFLAFMTTYDTSYEQGWMRSCKQSRRTNLQISQAAAIINGLCWRSQIELSAATELLSTVIGRTHITIQHCFVGLFHSSIFQPFSNEPYLLVLPVINGSDQRSADRTSTPTLAGACFIGCLSAMVRDWMVWRSLKIAIFRP